jgi:hypothetical protein
LIKCNYTYSAWFEKSCINQSNFEEICGNESLCYDDTFTYEKEYYEYRNKSIKIDIYKIEEVCGLELVDVTINSRGNKTILTIYSNNSEIKNYYCYAECIKIDSNTPKENLKLFEKYFVYNINETPCIEWKCGDYTIRRIK